MAREVFFCDVLRILLSEFDETQKQTSLGIKVSCCASGMFVIIMGAEHSAGNFFRHMKDFLDISCMFRGRQLRKNEISEANLVCWRTMLKTFFSGVAGNGRLRAPLREFST